MRQLCRSAGGLEAGRPYAGHGFSPGVRALALATAMGVALALAPTSAAPGEPLAESGILAVHQRISLPTATGDAFDAVIEVGIQDGWLTVDLRRAPLAAVLRMIGDRAGLRVRLHGELGGPITAAFTALALDQGIRRLIRGHSFALTYAPSRDGAGQPVLTEVRVYGAAAADGAAVRMGATGPPRPEPSAAAMVEAVAEQERAERMEGVATLAQLGDAASVPALAQVLATEPDAFVRAKAVRVLGHVGGEPALATLATALADPERAVRLQAIQAFGKVAGAGADATLAAVVANDRDPVVRRQAVQTLATLGTPEASRALGVAAADPSALVRQAVPAARPPAP
jgi:HEAT repeats